MRFIEYSEKLESIKVMAAHYRTGTPRQLASRLEVSERTVERMIRQLRHAGYNISYNRFRNSYMISDNDR